MGLFLDIFILVSKHWQVQHKIWQYHRIDGVLGIRTRNRRMVGADESTELWRPPETYFTTLEINVKNVLQYWSHPALFSLLKLL